MILCRGVGPSRLPLEDFFRCLDLGLRKLALTVVSSGSSLLCRWLFLLRLGYPFPSRGSELPGSSELWLRRASQLSSPAEKRVMSDVRVDVVLGLS